MEKVSYWIPIRTIAATEKDKWLECSNCGNHINKYEIENLRFQFAGEPEIYRHELETQYKKCGKCGLRMDMDLTFELKKRKIAKGDSYLKDVVDEFIKRRELEKIASKNIFILEESKKETIKLMEENGWDDFGIKSRREWRKLRQEILEINACSEDEFIKMVGYIIPDIEWLIYLKNIYRRESIWKMEEELKKLRQYVQFNLYTVDGSCVLQLFEKNETLNDIDVSCIWGKNDKDFTKLLDDALEWCRLHVSE